MENKRFNIGDIAKLAGVSLSTVSGVINNRPNVKPATRDRILQVIKECNYVPQSSARALAGKRSKRLCFLVSSNVTLGMANVYFSTILSGVNSVCQAGGYQVVVGTYDLSNISRFILPPDLASNSSDGLILAGLTDIAVIREIQKTGIPFIIINGDYPDPDILTLNSHESISLTNMLLHLLKLGHRRIIIPHTAAYSFQAYQRVLAALQRLDNYLDTELIPWQHELDEFAAGRLLANEWLLQRQQFTGLIANDQFAIAFLHEFLQLGGRCPADVSIVATENYFLQYCQVPLTALDERVFEVGCHAATHLLDLLEGKRSFEEVRHEIATKPIITKLIVRESTAPRFKE